MPNRVIKESITSSESLDHLTEGEEAFFYRLLVVCDDFGRMDARIPVLHTSMYRLTPNRVTDEDIESRLQSLEHEHMIRRYTVAGKCYLMISNWDRYQQRRAKVSKCPPPPEDGSDCNHMISDDCTCNPVPPCDSNGNQMIAHAPENREARSEKRGREATREESPEIANAPPVPDPTRPYLKKFLETVWTPCFPHSPLLPTTYSVDSTLLTRLDDAIGGFTHLPGGLPALFDDLLHRIGPAGETEISALRAKLTEKRSQSWHSAKTKYLAAMIEGMAKDLHERPLPSPQMPAAAKIDYYMPPPPAPTVEVAR